MEEHVVAANLQHSRARIRALLLPDPLTGRMEADEFPRSAAMRFLFDPRRRRLAMMALAMLALLAGRKGAVKAAIWPEVTQALGALLGHARR